MSRYDEPLHQDLIDSFVDQLDQLGSRLRSAQIVHANAVGDARVQAACIASYRGQMSGLRQLLRQHDPDNAEKYADPEADAVDEREQNLQGYRELVAFLDANPDVPVPTYERLSFDQPKGSDAERRAEVDRLAALLEVPVQDHTHHEKRYYSFEKWFSDRPRAICLGLQIVLPPEPGPADEPPAADPAVALLDAEQAEAAGTLAPTPPCGCEAGESCVDCAVRGDYEAEAEAAPDPEGADA